ncbi:methyltransferase [Phaeobacter sp. B1627]|uniref:methyltransferase n=1 Tax=Phaeobacter sp. B1627 TaxID=2583809 RepID=UPI001119ADF1|nr:class I SAM-dependent methyltransferase [Phaeobacter sp. B1627]TNJ40807.1 methyltransferase [Phaeobacter sp. B1627]
MNENLALNVEERSLPESDLRWLASFANALSSVGYQPTIAALFPLYPWRQELPRLANIPRPALAACVDLFFRGKKVPIEELPAGIRPFLPKLADLGMLVISPSGVASAERFVLNWSHGVLLWHERPSATMTLYFGPESVALGLRIDPEVGSRVLDLCAGPGFQTLVAARKAREVVAVEINPAAAGLLTLNAALNQLTNIKVICADLVDVQLEGRFDMLIANPPLVPIPQDISYVLCGDGGPDGLWVTRKILGRLDDWLTETGRIHFVGYSYDTSAYGPLAQDLSSACSVDMDLLMVVTGTFDCAEGTPAFAQLVSSLVMHGKADRQTSSVEISNYIKAHDIKWLHCFHVSGQRSSAPRISVLDFGQTDYGGWFA